MHVTLTLTPNEAKLGEDDRRLFWGRQFLNPFAFYGLEGPAAGLAERAGAIRASLWSVNLRRSSVPQVLLGKPRTNAILGALSGASQKSFSL